jgi:TRAP transporter TAXI family solute receptor
MEKPQPQVRRNIKTGISTRQAKTLAIPLLMIVGLVLYMISYMLQPVVQKKIVMTAGGNTGIYRNFAEKYAEGLKKDGITLEIRASTGAVENYERLKDGASEYDIGFVQSGIGDSKDAPGLQTLASVYYEPIWIFYDDKATLDRISQLSGKRIAIGLSGSGLRKITLKLLTEYGVTTSNSQFIEANAQAAFDNLQAGSIDAAFFIGEPDAPLIQGMLNSRFKLMNLSQADAIVHKFPSLSKIVFPRGATNLTQDMPPHDVTLISATALLVAKERLHPALTYLLLDRVNNIHSTPGFFATRGEFPNQKVEDFPISDEATRYFKSGRPFLQAYLPFWLANFIEHRLVILVPLLALLFTLLQALPRLYGWKIQARLSRWYGEIKLLEDEVWATPQATPEQIAQWQSEIAQIAADVHGLVVPQRYFKDIYALKHAVNVVRDRIASAYDSVYPAP